MFHLFLFNNVNEKLNLKKIGGNFELLKILVQWIMKKNRFLIIIYLYREAWFLVALAAASIVIIIMVVAILCVKSKSYKYKGKNPQLFISFSDKDIDGFAVLSCSVMITMCY